MKKIMAVLTVLLCFASTNVFAQLKEVRGVQTRVVEYQSNEDAYRIGYGRHGFEFKNQNNYPVWVEAELCTNGYDWYGPTSGDHHVNAGTCDTKNFTLNAGETYIWKCGDRMLVHAGINSGDYYEKFYVKYKAYKAE